MESVGTITLGTGTDKERTINITDMLRIEAKDHRLATIAKCEEGNYLLAIENPKSSGRQVESKMYLTEGSFTALLMVIVSFLKEKNMDLEQMIKEYNLNDKEVKYEFHTSEEKNNPINNNPL